MNWETKYAWGGYTHTLNGKWQIVKSFFSNTYTLYGLRYPSYHDSLEEAKNTAEFLESRELCN